MYHARASFYEKFDDSVLEYKDIVEKLDGHQLELERFVSVDSDTELSQAIVEHFNRQRAKRSISIFKLQLLQKISKVIQGKVHLVLLQNKPAHYGNNPSAAGRSPFSI